MISRRKFLIATAGGLILATAGEGGKMLMAGEAPKGNPTEGLSRGKTKVALVKTSDRATGIARAIDLMVINPVKGKDVLLKPNLNTADPFPGSTHNDTLTHLILHLKKMGSKRITIGERSGPPDTADVLRDMGIYDLHPIGDAVNLSTNEFFRGQHTNSAQPQVKPGIRAPKGGCQLVNERKKQRALPLHYSPASLKSTNSLILRKSLVLLVST